MGRDNNFEVGHYAALASFISGKVYIILPFLRVYFLAMKLLSFMFEDFLSIDHVNLVFSTFRGMVRQKPTIRPYFAFSAEWSTRT